MYRVGPRGGTDLPCRNNTNRPLKTSIPVNCRLATAKAKEQGQVQQQKSKWR